MTKLDEASVDLYVTVVSGPIGFSDCEVGACIEDAGDRSHAALNIHLFQEREGG